MLQTRNDNKPPAGVVDKNQVVLVRQTDESENAHPGVEEGKQRNNQARPSLTDTSTQQQHQHQQQHSHSTSQLRPSLDGNNADMALIMTEITKLVNAYQRVNLIQLFEEIFGPHNQRVEADGLVLKRTPPDQRLFGYAKEYVTTETKRLADGYRVMTTKREMLPGKLDEHQRTTDFTLKTMQTTIVKLAEKSTDLSRKLQDAEARSMAARRQAGLAKGQLVKGEEEITKASKAEEEARVKAADAEAARVEALQNCEAARRRADAAEQVAAMQARVAAQLQKDLVAAQEAMVKSDADIKSKLEPQITLLTERVANKEEELAHTRRELQDITAQLRVAQGETQRVTQALDKCEALAATFKERAEAAEMKLSSRDGNLEKALHTLNQNQVFSQDRIESLSHEKMRLETRVDELTREVATVTSKLFESQSQCDRLRDKNTTLMERITQLEAAKEAMDRTLNDTNARLDEYRSEMAIKSSQLSDTLAKLDQARKEETQWAGKMLEMTSKYEEAKSDATIKTLKLVDTKDALDRAMETTVQERSRADRAATESMMLKNRVENLETELTATRSAYESRPNSSMHSMEDMTRLIEASKDTEVLKRMQDTVDRLKHDLDEAKRKLEKSETEKRALREEVHNLKGNVRVVVRARPCPNLTDMIKYSVDGTSLTLALDAEQTRNNRAERHDFAFNRVFPPESSQISIYEEVCPLLHSVMDGYNVCLFSYGQTGSGKTFTMMGPSRDSDMAGNPALQGIIPRAVDHIFRIVAESTELGFEYAIEITFVEIYNETIRDLLGMDQKAEVSGAIKHEIIHRGGDVQVTNLRRVLVKDAEHVHELIVQAEKNRSVAATDKNHESSRSHSIFTAHVVGRHKSRGSELIGSLNLCDLAGSERIKASNVTGDRLKETQAINTSLSALNKVFASLEQKLKHIPIRDSVLTHMLSPCLSGDGKALMIVNLSSDVVDVSESLSSLRFAQTVNKTELGRAKKNVREVEGGGGLPTAGFSRQQQSSLAAGAGVGVGGAFRGRVNSQ